MVRTDEASRAATASAAPPSAAPPQPAPTPPAARPIDLEAFLGGRVLAWAGGLAVVVGLVLLFALGVSEGWITEGMRAALGGFVSLGLVGAGARLHEHRGRTHASLAAASAGIAGLFVTIAVSSTTYGLLPAAAGLALALATGALATALALRWDARGIAALGIVGGLCAPALAGAELDGPAVALTFVASASAVAVLLHRRWDWLTIAVFVCSAPQWAIWAFGDASLAGGLLAVVAFGLLYLAGALGFELRVGAEKLRASSAFLLAANALTVSLVGWSLLDGAGHHLAARLFIAAVALVHLVAGALARRDERISDDVAVLTLTLGVVVADVAWGLSAGGAVMTAGWVLGGLGFAGLAQRVTGRERPMASLGLGSHLALGLCTTLALPGQASTFVAGGAPSAGVIFSLVTLAAGCFASARLADRDGYLPWELILNACGLLVFGYLTALSLDGAALTAAFAAEAAALAAIAARGAGNVTGSSADEARGSGDARRADEVASVGALVALGIAGLSAFAAQAPPSALYDGLPDAGAALTGLGSIVVALVAMARVGFGGDETRPALLTAAAGTALYLASTLLVGLPDGSTSSPLFGDEVTVHEQGQMLLSGLWAIVGVAALIGGLVRDARQVRLLALGLLTVTIAKVFLYDLAALTSVYRVGSFIGLGLLLLGGAYAYQRLRPEPLPDYRDVPQGLR